MKKTTAQSRFLRITALVVTAAATVTALSGCGNGALGGSAEDDAQPTIAFIVPVLANPYWRLEADFAQAAADQLGITLNISDANSQEDVQINAVQSAISAGVDGIVIGPVTDAVGKTVLKEADTAGIPVTFMQRSPGFTPDSYEGDSYLGFVGTDDVQGGTTTAQALYDAGVRKVVAMTAGQGNSVAEDRLKGLTDFAAAHPDMEVLQSEYGQELRQDGQKTTENFLSAFPGPGFDGVWAVNDETGIGAATALANAGVADKVVVTGMDGTPDGVQAVIDGTLLSAPGGGYINGGFATVMLYDFLNGHEPKTSYVLLGFIDINSSNAEAFQKAYLDDPSNFDFKAVSTTYTPGASTDDFKVELK